MHRRKVRVVACVRVCGVGLGGARCVREWGAVAAECECVETRAKEWIFFFSSHVLFFVRREARAMLPVLSPAGGGAGGPVSSTVSFARRLAAPEQWDVE